MAANNQRKRAIELLKEGAFPHDWALVPVAGKETYVKGWTTVALDREKLYQIYQLKSHYKGLGVVTGNMSGGLVALDIDGPSADERYREYAGDAYMPYGEEDTWTTTSFRDGRRQIYWYLPPSVVPELKHVKKIIRRVDGTWHLGQGDPMNNDQRKEAKEQEQYEEFVFRFNNCQSVLPGSPHPITKKDYWWTNDVRVVKPAPRWVLDVFLQYRKPLGVFTDKQLEEIGADIARYGSNADNTVNQIRGFLFSTAQVDRKLIEKNLAEKFVFTEERFQRGFRWGDKGDGVNRTNYCPWHGGSSGTSFQYDTEKLTWFCFAEGIGGDIIDFIHKCNLDDITAARPVGADLENIARELCGYVGVEYDDINKKRVSEDRGMKCSPQDLLAAAESILVEQRDPARRNLALRDLIMRNNVIGMRPKELITLVRQHKRYIKNGEHGLLRKKGWSKEVSKIEPVIPGLLQTCRQYMVYSRGGVGKTALAMSIAKLVGEGGRTKVRGLDIQASQGDVLWVSNDQGAGQLSDLMLDQGLEEWNTPWFHCIDNWMSDQHDDLVDIISKIRPRLIVMDSLSTVIEGEEIKGEYADYLYEMSRCNGDPTRHGGFDGCAILWIHHAKKDGTDFRGSDRIQNAVDEVWSLRALTEEEEAEHGVRKRLVSIGKSRMGRSGDRLMVSMDREYNLSCEDMTPTLTREGVARNGDYTADSLLLSLLANSEEGMDRHTLREGLNMRLLNQGVPEKELISEWGMRKFLNRWLKQQLIEEHEVKTGGKGRPRKLYTACGYTEKSLSQINEDDPTTWPPQCFRLFGWPHRKCAVTAHLTFNEEEGAEGSTEADGSPKPETPFIEGDQERAFTVNQPNSEKVDAATDPGEIIDFGRNFHSLESETKTAPAPESDGVTDTTDVTQQRPQFDPDAFNL